MFKVGDYIIHLDDDLDWDGEVECIYPENKPYYTANPVRIRWTNRKNTTSVTAHYPHDYERLKVLTPAEVLERKLTC